MPFPAPEHRHTQRQGCQHPPGVLGDTQVSEQRPCYSLINEKTLNDLNDIKKKKKTPRSLVGGVQHQLCRWLRLRKTPAWDAVQEQGLKNGTKTRMGREQMNKLPGHVSAGMRGAPVCPVCGDSAQ